jgi:hypothetical protein
MNVLWKMFLAVVIGIALGLADITIAQWQFWVVVIAASLLPDRQSRR